MLLYTRLGHALLIALTAALLYGAVDTALLNPPTSAPAPAAHGGFHAHPSPAKESP